MVPLLVPLSWLFCVARWVRRGAYRSGLAHVHRLPRPVVVVGNITVGGTGKTPLVIWIARLLLEHGLRPGIVTRGYGGLSRRWPRHVPPEGSAQDLGDEAVLLARRAGCPVVAGPDRVAAARELLATTDCELVLADDGLQHYALGRDVEIAVVDGERRSGNGHCLPAGPLREPARRLREVDMVVVNGRARRGEHAMEVSLGDARRVVDERDTRPLAAFRGAPVHALAGVGNPGRFFTALRGAGLEIRPHAFPDHYRLRAADLDLPGRGAVLMTEKDAVRCRLLANGRHWYVPLRVEPGEPFQTRLLTLLEKLHGRQETARDPGLPGL